MAERDHDPKKTTTDHWLSRATFGLGEEPRAGMRVTERVRLVRPLESGGMGAVWVGEHLTLGSEVAVKFVRATDDLRMRERLSREAQLAARIDHPHAVRVFDHGHTEGGTPFIVMELLEGETLADRIERAGALSLPEVRRLVAQVAGVLAEAHTLGIAHRDIKPHNIVLLSATDELFAKVLDFGIAKPFEEELDVALTAEGEVVGTPVYMAPEQLIEGLPADARSDLWGLTVVTYQALTGRRPFGGRTRAALGAGMLLGRYERPSKLVPSLPGGIDAWVAANLDVDPKRRQSSARALARTFDEAASGAAPAPPSGPSEARLRIPDRLYGREAEIATLLRGFERAAEGRSRIVLVAGYSGIGKTSLVAEVEGPLAKRGATFVGGKLDPFDRGTPYASLVQAFRGLVRQILAGEDREAWSSRIHDGVGENLAALIDVIPELEELIGPQPPLEPTSPGEARHRFQHTFGRFVAAIASSDRPLVIFLDDLQWADLPTLELVGSLATNPSSRHVLLIGAYRDNEVDETHPLRAMIERVGAAGAEIDTIELGPLGEDAVLDLVSDATGGAPGRVRLAVACHAKTRGNAFFLRRFLESLTESELLRFDPTHAAWEWDLSAIQALPMNESVVDFVADQIRRLPDVERETLGVAACIGDRFELPTLAHALGLERGRALEGLRHALATELVLPQAEATWLTGSIDLRADHMCFRFAHDRIRQAARSLVDDAVAARIHGRVGRFLLDHLEPAERERRLFEVVEHLNRGAREELESTGAVRLRDLNLAAARRALASAAFEPAFDYYREAHQRLGSDAWSRDYEGTLAIHLEGARAAYLSGDHETMSALATAVIEHGRELLDRVRAEEVKIQALVSQQRFVGAIRLARDVLAELGVTVPEAPTPEDVQAAVGRSLAAIEERGADAIVGLPLCEDERVVTGIRIQHRIMSSAYLVAPALVPLLVSNVVRATVDHGVCRESPYGFAVLALVLNAANHLELAAGVGQVASGLLDRVDDRSVRPSTLHILACYVTAWTHPLRESVEKERYVFQVAMDVGDLEYASWGLHVGMLNAFCAGVDLAELAASGERDVATLRYHAQLPALACSVPIEGAVHRLRDLEPPGDARFDDAAHLESLREAGFRGAACVTASVGAFVRLIFRDLDGALAWARTGLEYADGATATYNGVLHHQTLALAALGRSGPDAEDRRAVVEAVAPSLEQLRTWRAASDANHGHRVCLVEAELARVEGRPDDAGRLYHEAIARAREERFQHEEALAYELAGLFYRSLGDEARARRYLDEARAAYGRWGARAKQAQLG